MPKKSDESRRMHRTSIQKPATERSNRPNSNESFGALFRDLHRHFSRTLQSLLTEHDITTAQWFFLRVLWDEDGLTQVELSNRVGLTTPTTVIALNGLQKKGLIERLSHPDDGRKFIVKLTKRGHTIEDAIRPAGTRVNEVASRGLPPDSLKQARHVLQTMRANLLKEAGLPDH